jgi:EAL domain-containing protein (putative c-di-GMP-specific phosphodiesterase class I)
LANTSQPRWLIAFRRTIRAYPRTALTKFRRIPAYDVSQPGFNFADPVMTNVSTQPNHQILNAGLSDWVIPIEVRSVVDLRTRKPSAAVARIGTTLGCDGESLLRFAERQGRGREVLLYLIERAAFHMRTWRARGFSGTLHIPLRASDLSDRTLATSLDIAAKSRDLDPASFTVVVPMSAYVQRMNEATNALMRIRKAGCGVAMAVDAKNNFRFRPLTDHPFSALTLGGNGVWKRMRTIGPGKLGALGSWLGWAEANGMTRTALGIATDVDEETAKLYGFTKGEGPLYMDFVPARTYMGDQSDVEQPEPMADIEALPPMPPVSVKRA